MPERTKKCPKCHKQIDWEAKVCPNCRTEFDISIHGYCTNCHATVLADENGNCQKCGLEVYDWVMESRPRTSTPGVPLPPPMVHVGPRHPLSRQIEIFPVMGEGVSIRFFASLVDLMAVALLNLPVIISFAILSLGSIDSLTSPVSLSLKFIIPLVVADFFIWVLYFSLQEWVFGTTLGKTLGAWPEKLKVILTSGKKLDFRHALLRAVVGFWETNMIGALAILFSPLHQRLGDVAAGTFVVDATRIHRVVFTTGGVRIEFLDGTVKTMARVTGGIITRWLGTPQWMTVTGEALDGSPLQVKTRMIHGTTLFNTMSRAGEFYRVLVEDYHIRFREKPEWWRIYILVIAMVLLIGIMVAFVYAYLIPLSH